LLLLFEQALLLLAEILRQLLDALPLLGWVQRWVALVQCCDGVL
jgi:hypothetical protein